jgi:hypothetical protein
VSLTTRRSRRAYDVARANPLASNRPLWEVRIAAHRVGRWEVPEGTTTLGGSVEHAKLRAIRWAHTDAGVPPIRSLIRESWPHVKATRVLTDA